MGLLIGAGLVLVWAMVILSMVRHIPSMANVGLVVILLAMMLGGSLLFARRLPHADQFLLPITCVLVGLGLVMIRRLKPSTQDVFTDYALRQVAGIGIGFLLLIGVAFVSLNYRRLARYKYSLVILGLALILGTKVFGTDPYNEGYKRWFGFHGVYYQPVELLKLLIVIFFAAYLDEKRELLDRAYLRLGRLRLPPLPYIAPLFAIWLLSLGFLLLQNDLGSALVFFGIFLIMVYSASRRIAYPVMGLILIVIGGVIAYHFNVHVRARIVTWWNPWPYLHQSVPGTYTNSAQLVQGLIGLANGGVIGTGLGQGSPGLIPVAISDFMFDAFGEELGLCGVMFIVMCYLIFAYRGLRIASLARDGYDKFLAIGLTTAVVFQAVVIIGGNIRLLPIAGVTLPLMSYGPSSLLTNFIVVGMLLRISADTTGG